jgi:type 1 glutamine amidotransferase
MNGPLPRRLLLVTGGHAFDAPALGAALDSLAGWTWERWNHPEAERRIGAGEAAAFDALLFHDMAGYRFAAGGFTTRPPAPEYVEAVAALTERGMPIVGLHHTLAGWAEWPEWGRLFGGRFRYAPTEVGGDRHEASGFRRDVTYAACVVGAHPVTHGLPPRFEWTDELYLAEVDVEDVVPLLRAEHSLTPQDFFAADAAIAGRTEHCRARAPRAGDDLLAWARVHRASRVVYLQCGDGPAVFGDVNFRRLLARALHWASRMPL